MLVERITISKRMSVILEDEEIRLLIDTLHMAINSNRLTSDADAVANSMIDRLGSMPE